MLGTGNKIDILIGTYVTLILTIMIALVGWQVCSEGIDRLLWWIDHRPDRRAEREARFFEGDVWE